MDLSQDRHDKIVNLIYATLEDKGAWRQVLEDLNDAIDGRAVHLLGIDMHQGMLAYSEGAEMEPHIDLEYIQRFQFIDPRVPRMLEPGFQGWMHCHEHFDDDFAANSPFYQEFLIPNDGRYMSAVKILDEHGAIVLLACIQRASKGPHSPAVVAFVDRLRPHLERACRIGRHHFVYSAQALVGHALVDQLRQPVVLMTTSGEVVQTNQAARRLFDLTRLVALEERQLVLPQPQRDTMLRELAAMEWDLRSDSAVPDSTDFRSLYLAGQDEALYCFYSLLVPERVMGSFGLRPLALVYLYHPRSTQEVDAALLAAAFGLSNAECRVASLLADGVPLREIATTLGVQYETVRKQLQSIYQKTSTNRQPELVKLLLHLPPATLREHLDFNP
ncbi:MAG: helix-turn-helix transcriptional regulator [Telluria sp.]